MELKPGSSRVMRWELRSSDVFVNACLVWVWMRSDVTTWWTCTPLFCQRLSPRLVHIRWILRGEGRRSVRFGAWPDSLQNTEMGRICFMGLFPWPSAWPLTRGLPLDPAACGLWKFQQWGLTVNDEVKCFGYLSSCVYELSYCSAFLCRNCRWTLRDICLSSAWSMANLLTSSGKHSTN